MPALIGLLLMSASAPGLAEEKLFRYDCGGAQVEIRGTYDASDPGCFSFHKFDLSVARATRRVSLDLASGFMHAACIKDSKGRAMVVFQQYCDGSGCHDLDNYGIVDPRTLNIVLKPTDTNREVAARILGLRKAPVLLDYPETLCCTYCNEHTRASGCLPYAPVPVTLEGNISRQVFPGPPNFESVADGDEKLAYWILRLDSPICVGSGAVTKEVDESEPGVLEIQIAPNDIRFYREKRKAVGKRVKVTGTLFHQHTGWHVTKVVLHATDLSYAQPGVAGNAR